MEVEDVTKVASRKRLGADLEKLRDKVTKESAKVIKLKVAQDTAYWDLKEKLHQVESNHERLQQNMLEVQMQHETISGQYQEELRLRPETLNKVCGTREICSVLESYSVRLKETLARCATDQTALLGALQRAGGAVRAAGDRARTGGAALKNLEDRMRLTTEHRNQLLQLFSISKQQSDKEISELKAKLEAALEGKEELVNRVHEMKRNIDMCAFDIGKRDETITNLQGDVDRLIDELSAQSSEAKNALDKKQKDLESALEENSSLKNTLRDHESVIKNICEQKTGLEEKITALENQQTDAYCKIQEMQKQLEEAAEVNEKNKIYLRLLEEEREQLKNYGNEKEKLITTYEEEVKNITLQVNSLADEKTKIEEELEKAAQESVIKTNNINELTATIEELTKKIEELENDLKNSRERNEEKIKEMTSTMEGLNKDLDSKASTITELMSELKTSTDIRSKLETTLQRVRKESEAERDRTKEKDRVQGNRIEQLEGIVRDKEEQHTNQVLEMRAERERLLEKMQGMQNTIDNIQNELTGRPTVVPNRIQPEHDDNAVMLTPEPKKTQAPSSSIMQKRCGFLAPLKESKRDSALYNVFSDSSTEGNTLDASEVNRRFEALSRGECLSPVPLAAFKRRGGVSAVPLKYRAADNKEGSISLSQVKNDINKERIFFKNKRVDNKIKKTK